jgi:putative tricarboxylic transport membrane protein
MMERSLYQALNLSHGSVMVFIQRPISATLLSIIVLMSIYVGIRSLRGKKTIVEEAEE